MNGIPRDHRAKRSVFIASLCLLLAPHLSANPTLSLDIDVLKNDSLVRDENAVIGAGTALAFLGELPIQSDLDALHGAENHDVLFSLDIGVELGGVLFRPCDVIHFDGVTWSKAFDCQAEGLPLGVNLDALTQSATDLLFSLDSGVTLGGQYYSRSDIIAFDGESFSMYLNDSVAGIPPSANLDALHLANDGRLLASFETGDSLDGVSFADEDVLSWKADEWSLVFDASSADPAWSAADLDAWSDLPLGDFIFASGFEFVESGDGCPPPTAHYAVMLHNSVRCDLNDGLLPNSPAPTPPVDMFVHSPALAQSAADWAEGTCPDLEYNQNATADFHANGGDTHYNYVGENALRLITGGVYDQDEVLERAVALWIAQAQDYIYQPFSPQESTANYTQLIWNTAEALDAEQNPLPKAVGCAVHFCGEGQQEVAIAICDYAPGGNYNGQFPYLTE